MTLTKYDVLIVGGGAAGIGAAIGARQARPNAKILVVEAEGCLGGAAPHRGVVSYCGLFTMEAEPRQAVAGVWNEIRSRLEVLGATQSHPVRHRGIFQVVEPEGLKVALDDLLEDLDIHVLLHATVVGAERTDGTITSVDVQDKTERRVISAEAFVDCSGDCDLAYYAGASTRYGNNGFVNLGSLATRWGGLQNAWPTAKQWSEAVQAAKAADPTLKQKIPKDGSVLIRLPKSRDIFSFMASAIVDVRSADSLTRAEQTGRKQAQEYLKILKTLPDHENIYLVSTGPNFGTRESRHITSRGQLDEHAILEGRRFENTIAIGAWGFEWHDDSREDWASTFTYPPHGCFEIPLSCLWSADTANLWAAGRCADGDQRAGSAIRVMGTGLATGQAAGVAAALRARDGCDPAVEEVRQVLKANGALLDQDNLVPVPYVGPSDGHN